MKEQFANYIDGDWHDSTEVTENRNPSDTNDVIGLYAQANHKQVAAAVNAAGRAFDEWSVYPTQLRVDILERIASGLLAQKQQLAILLAREEGKTLVEAAGEITRTANVFRFFAGEVLRQPGERLNSVRPGIEVEITREPVGVVGLITPWNVPMGIPGWKIAPALAYGNCVVFKPAELTPASAWALTKIIIEAGVPKGVFNLVMGIGSVTGDAMLSSPGINAISFTGSVATGRIVGQRCFESGKKVQMEMGGKNPLLILDDADLNVAVDAAVDGAFFSTGQRCTASSRLIITEGIYKDFVGAVKERISSLRVDHALKENTNIGPVVDERQLDRNLKYIEIARDEGATITGGQLLKRDTPGHYLAPALITDTDNTMRINREEVFGPVASVIRVKNYEEGLHIANDTEFGLSAGICTTSLKHASHFKRHAQSGVVTVNLSTCGVDYHAPFGGRKASSYGAREQGRYAVEFFTTVKAAYVRP